MGEKNNEAKIQSAIEQLQDNVNLPWGCSISKEASEIAIDALKKQIPQPLEDGEMGYGIWCSCGKYFGTRLFAKRENYCCDCGQKLDWSDEYETD